MGPKENMDSLDITSPISQVDHGVADIARRMASVAHFIKTEYCSGTTRKGEFSYDFMQSIYDRLVNYGWPLVREGKLEKTLLPGEKLEIDAEKAAKAMHALVPFLDLRAEDNEDTERGKMEVKLAEDLEKAARYTQCAAKGVHCEEILRRKTLAVTPPSTPPGMDAQSKGKSVVAEKDIKDDGPQVLEANAVLEPKPPVPQVVSIDAVLEPAQPKQTPDSTPAHHGHRRHNSRAWFENDAHFAELIGEPHQWTSLLPGRDHYLISSSSQKGAPFHLCDAKPLGISALEVIAMQHPLDASEVSKLDIDVLRFLRLVLWHWTNDYKERTKESESRKVVRREVEVRRAEAKQAAMPKTPIVCGQKDGGTNEFELLSPSFLSNGDHEVKIAADSEHPTRDAIAKAVALEQEVITPSQSADAIKALQVQIEELQAQIAILIARMDSLTSSNNSPVFQPSAEAKGPTPIQLHPFITKGIAAQTAEARKEDHRQAKYIDPLDVFGSVEASIMGPTMAYREPDMSFLDRSAAGPLTESSGSSSSAETESEDEWLAPLSTGKTLRSSRGRGRLEDQQEAEVEWQVRAIKIPTRLMVLKKCERLMNHLNSGDAATSKQALDLDAIPRLREDQVDFREV